MCFIVFTCCNHWWKWLKRKNCLSTSKTIQGNPSLRLRVCGHPTSFPASGHKDWIQIENWTSQNRLSVQSVWKYWNGKEKHLMPKCCMRASKHVVHTRKINANQLLFCSTVTTTSLQARHKPTLRYKQGVTIGNAATEKPLAPFSTPRLWQSDSSLATLTP